MNHNLYAIYDLKAESITNSFNEMNDDVVIRNLVGSFRGQPNSVYMTNPQDFRLYCIGIVDLNKSEVVPVIPPRLVCEFTTLVSSLGGDGQ